MKRLLVHVKRVKRLVVLATDWPDAVAVKIHYTKSHEKHSSYIAAPIIVASAFSNNNRDKAIVPFLPLDVLLTRLVFDS